MSAVCKILVKFSAHNINLNMISPQALQHPFLLICLLVLLHFGGLVKGQTAFSVSNVIFNNNEGQPVYTFLSNGGNTVYWVDGTNPSWHVEGNFEPVIDGAFYYTTPTAGIYHFDATVLILITTPTSEPPLQNVDIRLTTACNTTGYSFTCNCGGAGTIAQGGSMYLPVGSTQRAPPTSNGGFVPGAPNYALSVAWTGQLAAYTSVGVCVDNWASSSIGVELACVSSEVCQYSGFKVN